MEYWLPAHLVLHIRFCPLLQSHLSPGPLRQFIHKEILENSRHVMLALDLVGLCYHSLGPIIQAKFNHSLDTLGISLFLFLILSIFLGILQISQTIFILFIIIDLCFCLPFLCFFYNTSFVSLVLYLWYNRVAKNECRMQKFSWWILKISVNFAAKMRIAIMLKNIVLIFSYFILNFILNS